MTVHRFEHQAMATTFELRIAGVDAVYAAGAAREAFARVDRLEALLSRCEPESEISQIGRLTPGESLVVSEDTFDCIVLSMALREATHGAFDPTARAQIDRVKIGESSEEPPKGRLLIDPASRTVRVEEGAVEFDLGAIGKGFALDRIAAMFADWEISTALLVAGGSSLLALDAPGDGWEVNLGETGQTLPLKNRALGGSGSKMQGEHVVDPVSGEVARRWFRTWALAGSAAAADAFSTAFMNLERREIRAVCREQGNVQAILQKRERRPDRLVWLPPRAGDSVCPPAESAA